MEHMALLAEMTEAQAQIGQLYSRQLLRKEVDYRRCRSPRPDASEEWTVIDAENAGVDRNCLRAMKGAT